MSWILSAWAGTPVALPDGESAESWADAFDLAGIEPGGRGATVVIEVDGQRWCVRAGDRSVTVPAPRTDADRVEIAFLAAALARPLQPLDAPGAALPLPPPPPPLRAPDPVPVLALPPPEQLPPLDDLPPSEPAAPPPPPEPPPPRPVPAPAPEPAPPTRIATPPLAFAIGLGLRENTDTALTTRLRADVVTHHKLAVGTSLGVAASRWIWLFEEGWIPRNYWDFDVRVSTAWNPGRLLRIEALGGVALRSFRQQGRPIDEAFVPQVGAGGEFGIGGKLQVGLRVDATVDLRTVHIQDETGKSWTLSPFEVGLALVVKTEALGDPIGGVTTPGS